MTLRQAQIISSMDSVACLIFHYSTAGVPDSFLIYTDFVPLKSHGLYYARSIGLTAGSFRKMWSSSGILRVMSSTLSESSCKIVPKAARLWVIALNASRSVKWLTLSKI